MSFRFYDVLPFFIFYLLGKISSYLIQAFDKILKFLKLSFNILL